MAIEHLSDRPNYRPNKTDQIENTNGTNARLGFDYGMSHRSNGPVLNHSPFGAMTGDHGPKITRHETNSENWPHDVIILSDSESDSDDVIMFSSASERPSTSTPVETSEQGEHKHIKRNDSERPSTSTPVETPEQAELQRIKLYDSVVETRYPTTTEKLEAFCQDLVHQRQNKDSPLLKVEPTDIYNPVRFYLKRNKVTRSTWDEFKKSDFYMKSHDFNKALIDNNHRAIVKEQ